MTFMIIILIPCISNNHFFRLLFGNYFYNLKIDYNSNAKLL